MLYLIGLGLGNVKDLTLRGLEVARNCKCYAELYTSKTVRADEISAILGRHVTELKRSDLEEDVQRLIDEARMHDVAVFVPGDPLAATTHIDLVIEARQKGIPVEIVHNASIFSAVAETGLQLYKFGRTATVPFSAKLGSVTDALKMNRKAGLHTLLLLDLDASMGIYMSPGDALKILVKGKALKEKDLVIVAARFGTAPSIKYGEAKKLYDFKETPGIVVVPGKLHFREKDFLKLI